MIICIDFDGTIVDHEFPKIGKLKPGVKRVMRRLAEADHYIVVSSCRNNMVLNRGDRMHLRLMENFLDENDVRYGEIDYGDRGKVVADLYIDDKGLRFEDNWEEIEKRIFGKF